MAQQYPEDEFDQLAAQRTTVGAHRRPSNARPWLLALLAVLIVAPIVGILIGNAMSGDDSPAAEETTSAVEETTDPAAEATGDETGEAEATDSAEGATAEEAEPADEAATDEAAEEQATEEPAAEADMNHQILVLNGRGTVGFAGENQAILQGQGFGNVIVADYRGGAEPAESTIYYSAPEYEGTARAAADTLGVANVVEDAQMAGAYGVPIIAVMR